MRSSTLTTTPTPTPAGAAEAERRQALRDFDETEYGWHLLREKTRWKLIANEDVDEVLERLAWADEEPQAAAREER